MSVPVPSSTKCAALFAEDEDNNTGPQDDQADRPENNADLGEIIREQQDDTINAHAVPPYLCFYTREWPLLCKRHCEKVITLGYADNDGLEKRWQRAPRRDERGNMARALAEMCRHYAIGAGHGLINVTIVRERTRAAATD